MDRILYLKVVEEKIGEDYQPLPELDHRNELTKALLDGYSIISTTYIPPAQGTDGTLVVALQVPLISVATKYEYRAFTGYAAGLQVYLDDGWIYDREFKDGIILKRAIN